MFAQKIIGSRKSGIRWKVVLMCGVPTCSHVQGPHLLLCAVSPPVLMCGVPTCNYVRWPHLFLCAVSWPILMYGVSTSSYLRCPPSPKKSKNKNPLNYFGLSTNFFEKNLVKKILIKRIIGQKRYFGQKKILKNIWKKTVKKIFSQKIFLGKKNFGLTWILSWSWEPEWALKAVLTDHPPTLQVPGFYS